MIKINLASLKQSGLVGSGTRAFKMGGGIRVGLDKLNLEELKNLPLRRVITPLLICLLANYGLENFKQKQMQDTNDALGKLNSKNEKLKVEIEKFKTYDALKKDLDEDELLVKTKLNTIQSLMADRSYAVKLLTFFSSVIPRTVWLREVTLDVTDLTLVGASQGYSEISDFMKGLGDNSLLKDVTLSNTQQGAGRAELESAVFELKAKRR